MLWKEQYRLLKQVLLQQYEEGEASAIARLVVEHTGKADMRAIEASIVTTEQTEQINRYLKELLTHRPVQYVLNEAWFYNLKFEVNESVLIPRPETEELVELIIKDVRSMKYEVRNTSSSYIVPPASLLDIGTGSGCIPITIQKNIPEAEVTAVDVCSEALHVAMTNAVNHETSINFQLLDFLDESKWQELGMFDIIISNPPYIKTGESKSMSEHVLQYEPHKALFVPDDDALIFYRKIAAFATTHLKPGGKVYVEINQQLGKETAAVFTEKGFTNVELLKDMSGNERFVVCSL
ncbi:peptide chain release factor N(5)-glutamine methyltransferase [Lacibacter sp. MH-610]|uniref:peptide chain release factor N(5)-glutamine methyltransferase n=1 Tax=Lacibacter sp. MH-610 TaxID=3020883 RepID=UPI0038919450